MLRLTPIQEEYVACNGFVVIPSTEFAEMTEVYEAIKKAHSPVFVTTDTVLHTAHLFFDYVLRIVEMTVLHPQLVQLTELMLESASEDYTQASDADVKEAARRNLAYFSVGALLLDPTHPVQEEVADLVQGDLGLMRKRPVRIPPPLSPTMGIREDYTQYVPRGHYTRNDSFRRYFLAAMWYGRMGFFFYPSESHFLTDEDNKRLARQVLLITRCLHNSNAGTKPAMDLWRNIIETTALFAGRAEDPGPEVIFEIARQVYGGLPDLNDLIEQSRLNDFLALARDLPRPRVLSTYYLSKSERDRITPRWEDGTLGFHFLSQRFVPDTHIFSELVWDRVGNYLGEDEPFTLFVSRYEGPYRGVPRGLDVLAAFGSNLAESILEEEGDTDYKGYAEKLEALRHLYAVDELGCDLYHRWLEVLRALLDAVPEEAPSFMHNDGWARKQINASLGSWTELRHDTILYVKQSYTSALRGILMETTAPLAYVEPCPSVYRGLAATISQMRRQLGGWEMIPGVILDKLKEFDTLLDELCDVAERELDGQWPDEEEMADLVGIGKRLKAMLDFPPDLVAQILSGADSRMAMVADVHTHPDGGVVLEEAVGDPHLICVDLERDGQLARYWGSTYSYFEFKHPMGDRLTDEAWQAMSPKPLPPAWTYKYLAQQ